MTDESAGSVEPASAPPTVTGLRWRAVHHPFALGFFVTLGGLLALVLGLAVSNLSTVLIYVAFALFAALGLDPLVRFFEKRGVARVWGIVIVFVGFAIVLAGVLLLIIPTVVQQIAEFVNGVPQLFTTFQQSDLYRTLHDTFGSVLPDILSHVQDFITNPTNIASISGGVLKVGVSIVTGISGGIIVLVLSLYFTASLPTMKKSLLSLAPAYSRTKVASLTEEIADSIGGYLRGMVVLALCNAVFVLIMFLVLGLPFPQLFAVVAFCITLIPLVGTVLFWVIGSVFALFASPMGALVFAIAYLIYMQLEAYLLTPRVMNRTISIPGSLVVIGALVGGTLLGLLGALVAIPVTASVLLIVKQVIIPKQDAKLHPDA